MSRRRKGGRILAAAPGVFDELEQLEGPAVAEVVGDEGDVGGLAGGCQLGAGVPHGLVPGVPEVAAGEGGVFDGVAGEDGAEDRLFDGVVVELVACERFGLVAHGMGSSSG